jgi:ketosteroid isomerase-like protein
VIDDLVRRFFAAFDNRAGRIPSSERLHALFAPNAVVASHSGSAPVICTAEEFVRPRIELLSSGRLVNFSEWETHAETQVLGSLAVRRSRYAKEGELEGRPYAGTGTKFFQMALVGDSWRIVALSWIDDIP